MRITPVMTAYRSQNLQSKKQNIHFGKFQNEETRQYVKENFLTEEFEPYSSQILDYIDKTPFFTVKMVKGLNKKPFVYAVMNKAETDKHEYKTIFDNMRKCHYGPHKIEVAIQDHKKEAEIIKSEPEFLTVLEDFKDTQILSRSFFKAQIGYEYKLEPSKPESSNERSNFDKAVMLNGGGIETN